MMLPSKSQIPIKNTTEFLRCFRVIDQLTDCPFEVINYFSLTLPHIPRTRISVPIAKQKSYYHFMRAFGEIVES